MTAKDFFTTIVVPLVTTVTGVLAFSLNSSVSKFEAKLKEREVDRGDIAERRLGAEQQAQTHLQVYEAVMKSLDSNDPRKQKVATSLVIAMLNPDDAMRLGLLDVLKNEAAPEAQKQASDALYETRKFVTEQQTVTAVAAAAAPSPGEWTSYNFDIFWCSANGDGAREGANRIKDALEKAGAKGRLRVRGFSESINSSPGYRVGGLVIRREVSEEAVAQDVKKIADRAYGGGGDGFQLTLSTQGTPGYMGLFVCQ